MTPVFLSKHRGQSLPREDLAPGKNFHRCQISSNMKWLIWSNPMYTYTAQFFQYPKWIFPWHMICVCVCEKFWGIFSVLMNDLKDYTTHGFWIKPLLKGSFRNWEKHRSCNKYGGTKPDPEQLPLNHSWSKSTNKQTNKPIHCQAKKGTLTKDKPMR